MHGSLKIRSAKTGSGVVPLSAASLKYCTSLYHMPSSSRVHSGSLAKNAGSSRALPVTTTKASTFALWVWIPTP
ncbi:hypothetical protein B0H10DRAFT_2029174 [Mycena sp. CBHHK59/15]|nr:hypothetical protein B0H10DRAFT_2029174 [Mycena sp. CBHHK59/15]